MSNPRRTWIRAMGPAPPGLQDEDWAAWYAACMVAEQAGTDLPA